MANEQNLTFDIAAYNRSLTPEQRRENARKAGLASAAAKKRKISMREALKTVMRIDVPDADKRKALETLGIDPTIQNAVILAALLKAADGDIEAARFVRDTVGEKPTEQYNLGVLDKPVKSIDLTRLSDDELERLADNVDP